MKYGVIFFIKTNYLNATKTLYGVFMMHFIDMYGIRKRRWPNRLHYWLYMFSPYTVLGTCITALIFYFILFYFSYFEDFMLVLVLISELHWPKVFFWLLYRAGEDACTPYVTFVAVLLSVSHSQTVSIVVICWNYCRSSK